MAHSDLLSIEDDLDLGRDVPNVGSSISNGIKQVEMCTWDLVSKSFRFHIWSRLGLVATEPGSPDLVLSGTSRTGRLTQDRMLTPPQWPASVTYIRSHLKHISLCILLERK